VGCWGGFGGVLWVGGWGRGVFRPLFAVINKILQGGKRTLENRAPAVGGT